MCLQLCPRTIALRQFEIRPGLKKYSPELTNPESYKYSQQTNHSAEGLPIHKLTLSFCYQIFTNADKMHAEKALEKLGLEDCFEGTICLENLNPVQKTTTSENKIFDIIGHFSQPNSSSELPKTPVVCKPSEDAIEQALMLANIDPSKALFFDDSVRNIQAGKRIGLGTVLVGHSQKVKGADYVLESIHNIKEALPEL